LPCDHGDRELTLPGLITYCVPCVTFGKTHHRTRKDATMAGYEPINTSVRPSLPFHFNV
jgi:hypothetical protein